MKPFQWSFSRLKNFMTCPKKFWHVDLQKEFKDESDAMLWGQEVHKAMQVAVDRGGKLPTAMAGWQKWTDAVVSLKPKGWQVRTEQSLAMDKNFQATGYFDSNVWFRAKGDVVAVKGPAAFTIDWKTGKIHPEYSQLALSAQVIFAHYPDVLSVKTAYVWLADNAKTTHTYERDRMIDTWNQVMPTVKRMDEAHRTTTYPPKPSGICIKHCPVVSCPYHGKGSY